MPLNRRGQRSAFVFFASAALAGSVLGHRAMEALASLGSAESDYAGYEHVAVAPAGLLALIAAAAGIVRVLAQRRGAGKDSGIAVAGRALLSLGFVPSLAIVLGLQLAALNACENVEHLTAFGTFSDGLEWLGGPVVAALAVHGLIAAGITLLLRRSLESVLHTCDALFRAVSALVPLLARTAPAACFRKRDVRIDCRPVACTIASKNGLRAPPLAL